MTIEGFEFRSDVTDPVILARVTPEELAIMKEFTLDRHVVVGTDDEGEAPPEPRAVWLKVGNQSFCLDGNTDTFQGAEWLRWQLAKSLINFRTLSSMRK